jgi:hypothetical protein
MSITRVIATILRNSSNPVEDLRDYLVEKDSRMTRAESARMIRRFELQVHALVASLRNDQTIPSDADMDILEAAWFRVTSAGSATLSEILAAELRKRGVTVAE